MWQQFQLSLEYSSPKIMTILLNFGNVLVVANGLFIKQLMKKPNNFIHVLNILASYHEILARKTNVTIFFPYVKSVPQAPR